MDYRVLRVFSVVLSVGVFSVVLSVGVFSVLSDF